MAFNKSARTRIERIVNAEMSVAQFRRALRDIKSPFELHQIVLLEGDRCSWEGDDLLPYPTAIIKHPYCDGGTALSLYWGYSPGHAYAIYGAEAEADDMDRAALRFMKEVEKRYLGQRYSTYKIAFDPTAFVRDELKRPLYREALRWMPLGMTLPNPGRSYPMVPYKEVYTEDDVKISLR